MKLVTFKDGSRDGQLAAISRNLKTAHFTTHIAGTLQRVLDDWAFRAPQLQDLYDQLNMDRVHHPFTFDAINCMAPLPRAYQWADDSAYLNHAELVRKVCGAEMPLEFWTDPLMYRGSSDDLADAHDPIVCHNEAFDIDFEVGVVVITGNMSMGTKAAAAAEGIRLIVLANDVSLHSLIPAELGKGFGFSQNKPATSSSPVAVTSDKLGDVWRGRKVHPPMTVRWNNKKVGQPEYGIDMVFDFGQLIAHTCKTRNVRADSIIDSGTISDAGRSKRYARIAEKHVLETIESGAPITEYMRYGDTVKIEMFDINGVSIFGAIGQGVIAPGMRA